MIKTDIMNSGEMERVKARAKEEAFQAGLLVGVVEARALVPVSKLHTPPEAWLKLLSVTVAKDMMSVGFFYDDPEVCFEFLKGLHCALQRVPKR